MKRAIAGMAAMMLVLAMARGALAASVDTNGATVGKWTMDLAAAEKLAATTKLPILLDFSGSDWCGWCKLMEKNVFATKPWKEYATNNIIMVVIDFPKGAGIVPAAYAKRNEALQEKYGVEGFPTFIVLDDDGQTVLGRLGASEEQTAVGFITELQSFFRYRDVEVAKYTKAMNAKDRDTYVGLVTRMADTRKALKAQEEAITAAKTKIEDLQKQGMELEESAILFRATQLGPEKLKAFNDLKAKLDQAKKEVTDWLKTEPERTEENGEKFKAMSSEIQELMKKLQEF